MKLRARLACVVLATAIPVVGGIVFLRNHLEWQTAEHGLVDYALDRMLGGGREACELAPEAFPLRPGQRSPDRPPFGRGAGPMRIRGNPLAVPELPPRGPGEDAPSALRTELWAYGPDFVSRNREAPSFPAELKAALGRGEPTASTAWNVGEQRGIAVGVLMPWSEGPCAVMLVRRTAIGPPGAVRDLLVGSAVLIAVLIAAVFVAAGPLVERVRRLTSQVRESAASRYAKAAAVGGNDELTELAQAFNTAAEEVRTNLDAVEAREKALRAFVENTTHDVMLPLTVLQGHLTHLRRRAESGAPPEREVVLDALQEAHYMASLIHNLSAASRLESGAPALERHPVDLSALVERAVARHAPIAKARAIQLEHAVPPEPLRVEGDVTLLEQAVSNLIHNAVRYVEPNGHVAVVLSSHAGRFALRVLDDGPGIPDELRARVFERAFRSDAARSRHPGGMGLGLAIARDVVERHGFELELRRPETGGAEFEIRGPCAQGPAKA